MPASNIRVVGDSPAPKPAPQLSDWVFKEGDRVECNYKGKVRDIDAWPLLSALCL